MMLLALIAVRLAIQLRREVIAFVVIQSNCDLNIRNDGMFLGQQHYGIIQKDLITPPVIEKMISPELRNIQFVN
jgi:hypothetical protein